MIFEVISPEELKNLAHDHPLRLLNEGLKLINNYPYAILGMQAKAVAEAYPQALQGHNLKPYAEKVFALTRAKEDVAKRIESKELFSDFKKMSEILQSNFKESSDFHCKSDQLIDFYNLFLPLAPFAHLKAKELAVVADMMEIVLQCLEPEIAKLGEEESDLLNIKCNKIRESRTHVVNCMKMHIELAYPNTVQSMSLSKSMIELSNSVFNSSFHKINAQPPHDVIHHFSRMAETLLSVKGLYCPTGQYLDTSLFSELQDDPMRGAKPGDLPASDHLSEVEKYFFYYIHLYGHNEDREWLKRNNVGTDFCKKGWQIAVDYLNKLLAYASPADIYLGMVNFLGAVWQPLYGAAAYLTEFIRRNRFLLEELPAEIKKQTEDSAPIQNPIEIANPDPVIKEIPPEEIKNQTKDPVPIQIPIGMANPDPEISENEDAPIVIAEENNLLNRINGLILPPDLIDESITAALAQLRDTLTTSAEKEKNIQNIVTQTEILISNVITPLRQAQQQKQFPANATQLYDELMAYQQKTLTLSPGQQIARGIINFVGAAVGALAGWAAGFILGTLVGGGTGSIVPVIGTLLGASTGGLLLGGVLALKGAAFGAGLSMSLTAALFAAPVTAFTVNAVGHFTFFKTCLATPVNRAICYLSEVVINELDACQLNSK